MHTLVTNNFHNVITWTNTSTGWHHRYQKQPEQALNYLKFQVHNSLDLGWPKDKIIIITNFPFEHLGVKSYEYHEVRGWSAFANKLLYVKWAIDQGIINDNMWYHDVDAYQLMPFEFPLKTGVGFTLHAPNRRKLQGGSSFYSKDCLWMPGVISDGMKMFHQKSEETFFSGLFYKRKKGWKETKIQKYVDKQKPECVEYIKKYYENLDQYLTVLDWRYNFFRVHNFSAKWPKATKPIYITHFHFEYPSCVDCFVKGQNKYNTKVTDDRFNRIAKKYHLL